MSTSSSPFPPLLAVVPARAGSKGVPRKNVRRVGKLPLFAHTVEALRESGVATRLVVSTDDDVIVNWAHHHGVEVVERSAGLAGDATTIAEVAAAVAEQLGWQGVVGVFQPTSPLRSADSIRRACEHFASSGGRSLMSVVRERHLYWFDEDGDLRNVRPLFDARVNRQYATHHVVRETGAIQLIYADDLLKLRSMVAEGHVLFELPETESLDIDTVADLRLARMQAEQGLVVFRLTANRLVGSGHLYHCLELAEELDDQVVRFLLRDCDPFVERLLAERSYEFAVEHDLEEDLRRMATSESRLMVNDILDTSANDVLVPMSLGYRVVNIEDLGPGARFADWVVNALYPGAPDAATHVVSGPRYATLRGEFQFLPEKVVRERPEKILVTFGATDPAGLTERFCRVLAGNTAVKVTAVLGIGVDREIVVPDGIEIKRDVRSMANEMLSADLVLTSAGRTVYEAAATGTPVVVVAQNAREATHSHIGYDSGVIFLGIGPLVQDDHVLAVVNRLLADAALRAELSERLKSSVDGHGSERIASEIRRILKEGAQGGDVG